MEPITTNKDSNVQTMTLTRALATIKTLDKQIQNDINLLAPTSFAINGQLDYDYSKTPEEFIAQYKSARQSITAKQENQRVLKQALHKANSDTTFTLAGKPYSITGALNTKANLPVTERIISQLLNQLTNTSHKIDKINKDVEQKVQQQLSAQGSNAQKSKDYIESTKKDFEKLYGPVPVNLAETLEEVKKMQADVALFRSEIDMLLSEINASTLITVILNNAE
jgi:hypothetical protein